MHANNHGFFSVLRKSPVGTSGAAMQVSYAMDQLQSVMQAIGSSPDTYISQASFVRPSRRITDLGDIGGAWVDIDCYKLGISSTEEFAMSLLDQAEMHGIPLPTYIMSSGRGLYLKWLFKEPINATLVHRWNTMQTVLTSLYKSIGGDMASRDPSRVLRVVGSVNSTANTSTSVVRPIWASDQRYSFLELHEAASRVNLPAIAGVTKREITIHKARVKKLLELDPHTLADIELQQKISIARLRNYSEERQPIMMPKMSMMQLNWQRFIDLRDLSIMRGGVTRGSRDLSLFWMSTFLSHSGIINPKNFESEVRALASSAQGTDFDPIRDQSLSSLFERLQARDRGEKVIFNGQSYSSIYTPTNDKLIDIFEITPEEQASLSTIIDAQEKLRRSDAKVPGRSCRRQERIDWRSQAHSLAADAISKGLKPNVTEIAKQVDVHKTQVSRLLNNKIGQPRKKAPKVGRNGQCMSDHKHYGVIYGLRAAMGLAGKASPRNTDKRDLSSFYPSSVVYPKNPSDPFKRKPFKGIEDIGVNLSNAMVDMVVPADRAFETAFETVSAGTTENSTNAFFNLRQTGLTPSFKPAVAVFSLSSKRYPGVSGFDSTIENKGPNSPRPTHVENIHELNEALDSQDQKIPLSSQSNSTENASQSIAPSAFSAFNVESPAASRKFQWPQRSAQSSTKVSQSKRYPFSASPDIRMATKDVSVNPGNPGDTDATTASKKASIFGQLKRSVQTAPLRVPGVTRPTFVKNVIVQREIPQFVVQKRDLSSMGMGYLNTLSEADQATEMSRLMEVARQADMKFKADLAASRLLESTLRQQEHKKVMDGLLEKSRRAKQLAQLKRSVGTTVH